MKSEQEMRGWLYDHYQEHMPRSLKQHAIDRLHAMDGVEVFKAYTELKRFSEVRERIVTGEQL